MSKLPKPGDKGKRPYSERLRSFKKKAMEAAKSLAEIDTRMNDVLMELEKAGFTEDQKHHFLLVMMMVAEYCKPEFRAQAQAEKAKRLDAAKHLKASLAALQDIDPASYETDAPTPFLSNLLKVIERLEDKKKTPLVDAALSRRQKNITAEAIRAFWEGLNNPEYWQVFIGVQKKHELVERISRQLDDIEHSPEPKRDDLDKLRELDAQLYFQPKPHKIKLDIHVKKAIAGMLTIVLDDDDISEETVRNVLTR